MKRLLLLAFILVVATHLAYAFPSVDIASPTNTTYYNNSLGLVVSSNESITTWYYSLDGVANTTFTPNTSISVSRGAHNIYVTAYNGSVNNSARVYFTMAYITVLVLNLEDETSVGSGINTRILSTAEVQFATNATNNSGGAWYLNLSYGTYKIQAGGPANSSYPHIFTYTFTFNTPTTDLTLYLPQTTACWFVTYQYVDSFYQTPLDAVNVTFHKATHILTEEVTDTNGFTTICLVPGLGYILESTKASYLLTNFTDRATLSSQYVQMQRSTMLLVTEAAINMNVYPLETDFYPNDTIYFGLWINDTESKLTSYGVVYGRSEEIVKDDTLATVAGYRVTATSGNTATGSMITCTVTDMCLDVEDWEDGVVYAGYYYQRGASATKVWKIRRLTLHNSARIKTNFYTNYTSQHDPRVALKKFFASIGYASSDDGPSLGMVTFSMFIMIFSAAGAAKKGWGILGSMVVFMASDIIMVLLGLIQWWSILVAAILLAFLGRYMGGLYT